MHLRGGLDWHHLLRYEQSLNVCIFKLHACVKFALHFTEDVDECALGIHMCSENSVCVNTEGEYVCDCQPGFYGTYCGGDYCNSGLYVACLEGRGECEREVGGYHCICADGYFGEHCEREDLLFTCTSHSWNMASSCLV